MGSMNVLCCSSVVGERTGTASRLSYHQYDFVCGHQVKGISIKMSYINNNWYYIQAQLSDIMRKVYEKSMLIIYC